MSNDFVVDGSYEGYVYLGHAAGRFENQKGERQNYYNLYVFSPVTAWSSDDYSASGYKAEKLSCVGPVWEGLDLHPGDHVILHFDARKKVTDLVVR